MVASSASSLLRIMLQSLRSEATPDLQGSIEQEGGDSWRGLWLPDLVDILYSGQAPSIIIMIMKNLMRHQIPRSCLDV